MMIEKTYGEAIYGYDLWSTALNESLYVLWLQKENSEEKLQLDIFNNINFGLPKVKIGVDQVIGLAGGVYSGLPTIENREFSFKTFFAGNDYKTALNAERIDYILNWFEYNKYEKMYLYWFVKDRLKTYRIEVRPSISGEQYNKYIIAKDVGISLISEKSYFEAVEETEISETLQTTEESIETIVYDDWYLPSIDELAAMFSTLKFEVDIGGFNEEYYYSSTDEDAESCCGMFFRDGTTILLPKNDEGVFYGVRPIRHFISSDDIALRTETERGFVFWKTNNPFELPLGITLEAGEYCYYECAKVGYETTKQWGAFGVSISGTETDIGKGKSNTALIVAALELIPETDKAAQYCNELSVSVPYSVYTPKTGDHIISILNNGLETPFILEITPLESTPYLKVINDKGAGFESYYSFPANKKIVIDTATGIVTLDGTVMNSFFSSGSLFNLARGTNRIYINLINCDFAIRFRERVK